MLILVLLLGLSIEDIDIKDLTPFEKDKHLACSELVSMKSQMDRKTVNELLKQDTYLKKGIIQMISLDMMIQCVNLIDDELVSMMYVNMERVVKVEGVREERIKFINVDYNKYKDLNEFIYEQHHRDMLKISLALRDEQKERMRVLREEREAKEEKEKEEKERKDNQSTGKNDKPEHIDL